jgi:hypothetical protein
MGFEMPQKIINRDELKNISAVMTPTIIKETCISMVIYKTASEMMKASTRSALS